MSYFKGITMKIKVFYPNKIDYVDASELEALIKSGAIMGFKRQHKLVVVGMNRTRKAETTNKRLVERRMSDG